MKHLLVTWQNTWTILAMAKMTIIWEKIIIWRWKWPEKWRMEKDEKTTYLFCWIFNVVDVHHLKNNWLEKKKGPQKRYKLSLPHHLLEIMFLQNINAYTEKHDITCIIGVQKWQRKNSLSWVLGIIWNDNCAIRRSSFGHQPQILKKLKK